MHLVWPGIAKSGTHNIPGVVFSSYLKPNPQLDEAPQTGGALQNKFATQSQLNCGTRAGAPKCQFCT